MYIYVMHKVWIGTIRRLSCAIYGSIICAIICGLCTESMDCIVRKVSTVLIITVGHRTFFGSKSTNDRTKVQMLRHCGQSDAAGGAVLASWLTAGLWLPY